MRRLGVIGRADHGGIAAQTLSVARNMPNVEACLVLDLGKKGRGPFDPTPWLKLDCDVRVARYPFGDADLDWIIDASDVIYEPEGPPPFRDDFVQRCGFAETEFVIHVNPELWRTRYDGPTVTKALPTSWHADRFPDATFLPMPVDTRRFQPREGPITAARFFHLAAPAMDDRNGTGLVRAALPYVGSTCTLTTRGVLTIDGDDAPQLSASQTVGNVAVRHFPAAPTPEDVYPTACNVLVLPRRYGGLSLPMLEAAALGWPIVSLDLPPQDEWLPLTTRVPVSETPTYTPMIGGSEAVYDARPEDLAAVLDLLATDRLVFADARDASLAHAAANSWDTLLPRWLEVLG